VNDQHEHIRLLVDYTTLIYHEARNVRHLIKAKAVVVGEWSKLVMLPVNKLEAWKALQVTRSEAKLANSVRAAQLPFEKRFGVNLDQLQMLYENPGWRNASYGGNAWQSITALVRGLANALEQDRPDEVVALLAALSQARHNTGTVSSKLSKLDEALE
jgi:hypothetical protein